MSLPVLFLMFPSLVSSPEEMLVRKKMEQEGRSGFHLDIISNKYLPRVISNVYENIRTSLFPDVIMINVVK